MKTRRNGGLYNETEKLSKRIWKYRIQKNKSKDK